MDLAAELLKAHSGDQAARGRLLRNALPMAANLVRPGSGRIVRRGLELLDTARDGDRAELGGGETGDVGDVGDFEAFVTRLLSRPYGFYVIVGEPETGKTTLALRLAQRLTLERHYKAVAVGGFHPDDRRIWGTDTWVEYAHPASFLKAMGSIQRAMVAGREYPAAIMRRVVLLDDASLTAHSGAAKFNRALLQAWNAYRHLKWIIVVTARTFKSIGPVAEACDARFMKKPEWGQLTTERPEAVPWWRDADDAYRGLRRTPEWREAPNFKQWVYVHAPRLRYTGMLPYGGPLGVALGADEDPDELDGDRGGRPGDFVAAAEYLEDEDLEADGVRRQKRARW